jgi:hypothetical protein
MAIVSPKCPENISRHPTFEFISRQNTTMGIGFVILIHLVVIFIAGVIVAVVVGFIVTFFSKERWGRKFILAIACPFVGLYTLYFAALTGSIIVSEYKHIDIGIGDAWYVPLSTHCELLFVDETELGYIACTGQAQIPDISEVAQDRNSIYARTDNGEYYVLNAAANKAEKLTGSPAMNNSVLFKKASNFYFGRRNEIAGTLLIVVGVLSLLVSIAVVYVIIRIVLKM